MSVQPASPPAVQPVAPSALAADLAPMAAAQVAAEHQAAQTVLVMATLAAILEAWGGADPLNWFGSWWRGGIGERIFVLMSAAQEVVTGEATAYVTRALSALGAPAASVPTVSSAAFVGRAADGRSLETLLAGVPTLALQRTRRGDPPAVAERAAREFLTTVVRTELADAGRAADHVAITGSLPPSRRRRSTQYGWVRMLTLPSCTRCIVLAGRFYRWNQGFQRHENCDCRHIPAIEAVEGDLTVDPYAYFRSLSAREQDIAFGKANAEAIRAGADINQVINASTRFNPRTGKTSLLVDPLTSRRYTTEGTTRRGFFGRNTTNVLRPTPWQLVRDANGDRDEAVRLLREFGYILR